jgi:type IV pilus assembly protein PilB
MADPRQPTGNASSPKKIPVASSQESAAKPDPKAGMRDLIPQPTSIINHLVSDEQLQQWMKQVNEGEGAALMHQDVVATGFMNEDVLDAIAADMGMEKVILSEINVTPELIAEVPANVAKKYGVVPVRSTEHEIWLALSDPHNVQALDDLSRVLNKRVHGMVAMEDDIERAM